MFKANQHTHVIDLFGKRKHPYEGHSRIERYISLLLGGQEEEARKDDQEFIYFRTWANLFAPVKVKKALLWGELAKKLNQYKDGATDEELKDLYQFVKASVRKTRGIPELNKIARNVRNDLKAIIRSKPANKTSGVRAVLNKAIGAITNLFGSWFSTKPKVEVKPTLAVEREPDLPMPASTDSSELKMTEVETPEDRAQKERDEFIRRRRIETHGMTRIERFMWLERNRTPPIYIEPLDQLIARVERLQVQSAAESAIDNANDEMFGDVEEIPQIDDRATVVMSEESAAEDRGELEDGFSYERSATPLYLLTLGSEIEEAAELSR